MHLSLIFSGAVGVALEVARHVAVIVGTRVGGLTPFEGGLSSRTGEVERCGGELGALAGVPVPSQLCHGLVVAAHAGVAFHQRAVGKGLVAPVGVVVIGSGEVVSLLHHGGRAAALRGGAEESEVEAVLIVEFLLNGEEVAGCFVEGAFGIAFACIAAGAHRHDIPSIANLASTHGGHHTMVVGAVGEGVTQRDLFAVL